MAHRNAAPPELIAHARALAAERGTAGAAKALGISTESFARLVGGLGVRRGTIALVEREISRLEAFAGNGLD